MKAGDRLVEAWAVLGAASRSERIIRTEPTGTSVATGEILAGLDVDGARHLFIPVASVDLVTEDRHSAGVQIRRALLEENGNARSFIDVVCLIPRLNDLFAQVAEDMLELLKGGTRELPEACREVLERWRELLEHHRPDLLTAGQLTGLYGELLILNELVSKHPVRGLETWTGPSSDEHDFTCQSAAIEVKTTTVREGRIVQVHGIRQLEPPAVGPLYLAFVRLDVENSGTSITSLVEQILAAGVPRRAFIDLLAQVGYEYNRAEDYAFPRFIVRELRYYTVAEDFPRIVSESFVNGALPAGVLQLAYAIDLTGEPPVPLSDEAARSLLQSMAGRG